MVVSAFDPAIQTQLLHQVTSVFNVPTADYTPLLFRDRPLGRVAAKWKTHLLCDAAQWVADAGDHLILKDEAPLEDIANGLQNVAMDWYFSGLLSGWRNEFFLVQDPQTQAPLFPLERSAFRPLGLLSQAVHINGLTLIDDVPHFWIGTRSPFKAVDPNKLDNLVGGGVSAGETIPEAMMREGWEEAGMCEADLSHLEQKSRCLSLRAVSRGLHREYLHIFDCWLSPEATPQNQDGEVAEFNLMTPAEVASAIINQRFMNDATLATLDCLLRLGYISQDHALAAWLRDCRNAQG
ncbi:MAG: NUDIX domain-containing protein [Neisseriaceae bacterium]|nr:NUDIX domain-containing protein [Neisseriaceae bacterium]